MNQITARILIALLSTISLVPSDSSAAEPLLAGVSRIDITHPKAGRINDPFGPVGRPDCAGSR